MTKTVYKIAICLVCLIIFTSSVSAQTVKSILVEMDKIMNKNCIQTIRMDVWDDNELTDYIFTMKAKHNNQYLLLRYVTPERWKETEMLMIKEDIWIYDRNADRIMQVPRSMAFGGTDIAHGDMLRLNISNKYDGKIIAEDEETWTIDLTTIDKNTPYHSIEIVINKKGKYPIVAKCFSKSKKHIKTIEYSEVKELNGVMKPTKYSFLSPYEPDKYSIINVLDEKLIEYPDYIFDIWAVRDQIDEKYNR